MKKIPVWKNVTLTISALAIVIIATFAWFYTGQKADINDFAAQVGEASYIQISGDKGNNWSEDLNVELGINKNFKEISGDGINFFAPVYDTVENANGAVSTQLVSFTKLSGNEYYYEQTLDFRSDSVQSVYISPESYVASLDNQGNGYIDGAIRIAFFEIDADGNEILNCIWAPNSTVEFSGETNSFNREGTVEPYYFYQKSSTSVDLGVLEDTNSHIAMISTEGTDENGCGYNQEYKFMWTNGQNMPVNSPSVLTLDAFGQDGHFHKSLKVKVWLEGYDRECVSLLSGQKFTINLQFIAKEEE